MLKQRRLSQSKFKLLKKIASAFSDKDYFSPQSAVWFQFVKAAVFLKAISTHCQISFMGLMFRWFVSFGQWAGSVFFIEYMERMRLWSFRVRYRVPLNHLRDLKNSAHGWWSEWRIYSECLCVHPPIGQQQTCTRTLSQWLKMKRAPGAHHQHQRLTSHAQMRARSSLLLFFFVPCGA